eukprot:3096778-Amphidinium_carterae.1
MPKQSCKLVVALFKWWTQRCGCGGLIVLDSREPAAMANGTTLMANGSSLRLCLIRVDSQPCMLCKFSLARAVKLKKNAILQGSREVMPSKQYTSRLRVNLQ